MDRRVDVIFQLRRGFSTSIPNGFVLYSHLRHCADSDEPAKHVPSTAGKLSMPASDQKIVSIFIVLPSIELSIFSNTINSHYKYATSNVNYRFTPGKLLPQGTGPDTCP